MPTRRACLGPSFSRTPVQRGRRELLHAAPTRTAAAEGLPVYLLGAKGEAVKGTAEALKEQYPDLVIAGWRDGYFNPSDPSVAADIRGSGAKVLFVAMGIPRQEVWVRKPPIFSGGHGRRRGSRGFRRGLRKLKRAPEARQKLGLECVLPPPEEPWAGMLDLDTSFSSAGFFSRSRACAPPGKPEQNENRGKRHQNFDLTSVWRTA